MDLPLERRTIGELRAIAAAYAVDIQGLPEKCDIAEKLRQELREKHGVANPDSIRMTSPRALCAPTPPGQGLSPSPQEANHARASPGQGLSPSPMPASLAPAVQQGNMPNTIGQVDTRLTEEVSQTMFLAMRQEQERRGWMQTGPDLPEHAWRVLPHPHRAGALRERDRARGWQSIATILLPQLDAGGSEVGLPDVSLAGGGAGTVPRALSQSRADCLALLHVVPQVLVGRSHGVDQAPKSGKVLAGIRRHRNHPIGVCARAALPTVQVIGARVSHML